MNSTVYTIIIFPVVMYFGWSIRNSSLDRVQISMLKYFLQGKSWKHYGYFPKQDNTRSLRKLRLPNKILNQHELLLCGWSGRGRWIFKEKPIKPIELEKGQEALPDNMQDIKPIAAARSNLCIALLHREIYLS